MKSLMKYKFINIYPHEEGKSRQYQVHSFFYYLVIFLLLSVVGLVLYFNGLQIYYSTAIFLEERKKNFLEKNHEVAREMLKSYSIHYEQKQNYLLKYLSAYSEEKIPMKKFADEIFGVGGEGEEIQGNKYVDKYGEKIIDLKRQGLNDIENVDKIILEDIETMPYSIDLVKNFNIEINERRNLLQNLPNLWPVQKGRGKIDKSHGKDADHQKELIIRLENKENIINTAKGKVTEIIEDRDGKYDIEVEHNFGFKTYYQGLENVVVKQNDMLRKGTVLGEGEGEVSYKIKIGKKYEDPSLFTIIKY